MASGIDLVYPKIKQWNPLGRGLLYGCSILAVEYISGSILTRMKVCPWSYEGCKYAVKGLIRLDYLPLWMAAGLLFEKLLVLSHQTHPEDSLKKAHNSLTL